MVEQCKVCNSLRIRIVEITYGGQHHSQYLEVEGHATQVGTVGHYSQTTYQQTWS